MAKKKKDINLIPNNYEIALNDLYIYHKLKLMRICMSRFTYTIPKGIYLPKKIIPYRFLFGKIIAYKDKDLGLVFPLFSSCEMPNFYGYPSSYELFSDSEVWRTKVEEKDKNLVIGYSNICEQPYFDIIEIYAKTLAMIDLVRLQNLKLSRGFITATTPREQELTIKQVMKDWLGFEQFTLLSDKYGGSLEVEGKEITFKGNEYNQFKKSILGEYLEAIGVKSIDIEKGSHILNAEASRSEASTDILINDFKSQKEFLDEVNSKLLEGNDKFSIEINSNIAYDILKEYQEMNTNKGVEEDAQNNI